MICPTCKKEAGDKVCMCGVCPACDPVRFAPSVPYDPETDPNDFSNEVRAIAAEITEEGL